MPGRLVWTSKPWSIPPQGLVPHPPRTRSASTWVALPPGPYTPGLNHKFCFGSVFRGGGFGEGTGKFSYIDPGGRRLQGLCHLLASFMTLGPSYTSSSGTFRPTPLLFSVRGDSRGQGGLQGMPRFKVGLLTSSDLDLRWVFLPQSS